MEDQEEENNGGPRSNSLEESNKKRERGNKIRIKLRILKDKEEVNKKSSSAIEPQKICAICKKGFGSGKALGGHMRIHLQANNNNNGGRCSRPSKKTHVSKLNMKLSDFPGTSDCKEFKANDSNSSMKEYERSICLVCNKGFPSMKSLFGHMRCHPERDWRGIQPPLMAATKNSSHSTGSDDSGFKSLPAGWSVTGKRGRKAKDVPIGVFKVAYDLMMLAQERPQNMMRESGIAEGISMADKGKRKFEEKNGGIIDSVISPRNSASERPKIDNCDENITELVKNEVFLKGGSNLKLPDQLDSDDEYWLRDYTSDADKGGSRTIMNSDAQSIDGTNKLLSKSKKIRKMNLKNFESTEEKMLTDHEEEEIEEEDDDDEDDEIQSHGNSVTKFKCITCNKSFPTYQALGGHRSSHNKEKIHHFLEESVSIAGSAAEETAELEEGDSQLGAPFFHKCKFCPKRFLTGQALGGHQRSHWEGQAKLPANQEMFTGEGSQNGLKSLAFDLNQPPVTEDGENFEFKFNFR
ncbi:hypothetical protein Nepgr_013277 [Nepenthes gracilis]|uniref:C2H2-type domain-containing protein n=1 Tax=Nepenthes gracilis TaxID=150966 RepID=A0AAD3SIP7_NEPGR|nr:hypothetical protein Nepgr_013277 [Nepenthes gracilis]